MSFTNDGKHHRCSTEAGDRKLAQRIFDKVKGEIAEKGNGLRDCRERTRHFRI